MRLTTLGHEPAQRQLVHQLIDWERVTSRRERYPEIGRAFPLETLKTGCESPPYYCHYMSWRLGTWEDESLFRRLEDLLCCAEALPDWEDEKKSLVSSADFAEFWSLVWQLQVAEHLCEVGTDVRWAQSGPDLSVKTGDERWYVECYTPRKSFGLLRFLEELLRKLDSDIRISYDLCLPFQLPQNSDRNSFLDKVMSQFRDPTCLAKAKEAAKQKYPVILYREPESSLHVYLEGDGVDAYMPGIVPNRTGSPELYVEQVLREAANAKKCSNALAKHRPNLLAVNFLLSDDYQLARSSRGIRALLKIEPNIDVLAASTVGINERLTMEKLEVVMGDRSPHVNHKNLNRIAAPLGARIPGGGQ